MTGVICDRTETEPAPVVGAGKSMVAFLAWVVVSFAAASLGALFPPGEWYAQLEKPSWNPPGWLFGPVWSMLYLMMGIAAWMVWRQGGFRRQSQPLSLFLIQLALNALWTPLFFGLQRPDLAFFEIILLWAAILATVLAFSRVNRLAAVILLPYLAWVSFASFLNFTLWRMNG